MCSEVFEVPPLEERPGRLMRRDVVGEETSPRCDNRGRCPWRDGVIG